MGPNHERETGLALLATMCQRWSKPDEQRVSGRDGSQYLTKPGGRRGTVAGIRFLGMGDQAGGELN